MGLETYRRKRDFAATPEPEGEVGPSDPSRLTYVIQQHAARRLHYDFRLELDGVLLSWAVPKGPSLDPGDKRLAVRTEDHPLAYGAFEGTIPKGEYGGGTVLLWDRGTWTPHGDARASLDAGRLTFELHGERLGGRWHLVRSARGADWLLIKGDDSHARRGHGTDAVDGHDTSVTTGRDLARIASAADRVWTREAGEVHPDDPVAGIDDLPGAIRGEVAWPLAPSLATAVDAAPDGERWIHELKLDGYRILARSTGDGASLVTRSGLDWTARLAPIARAVEALGVPGLILDGELVAVEPNGRTSFSALQRALSDGSGRLELHAFDLLAARGIDLRGVALLDRKAQLERVVGRTGAVRYVDHVVGRGPEVFDHACRLGAEGIVSKRADGTYRSGRHRGWTKSKCRGREDFVIGGYVTRGTGLSSLLLGERDADGLRYVGRVGTGFTEADRRSVRARLEPLRRPDPPFTVAPPVPRRDTVTWVEPSASVEIAFAERTRDGMVRHASFLGLRDDRASPPSRAQAAAQTPVPPVSNADKVLYPEVGLTKGELAAWIHRMAPWILPHVANRPLSLVRCPNGHDRPCFFQKHHLPGSAAIHPVDVPGSDQRYLAIDDAAGLVALVQLGALEIHPWGSTVDHLEHPDRLVIDLDPDESLGFDAVVAAALDVRERLDAIGLQTYPRWTGGKGVHVVAPLTPTAPWATVKELSRRLAHAMVRDAPSAYVAVATKARRRGKVFVDWLRNGRGATAIASWSFRARPGAPVAVPLTWDALTPDLDRSRFTVRDLEPPEVDPWSGFDALEQAVDDRMVARLGPS